MDTILPTTLVGSYPQPDWLIDRAKLAGRFRPRVRAGELWRVAPEWLEHAQDDATLSAIRDQERAGLDSVDGKPHFKWSVSTGARGYATPSGRYKVSWLDEHHKSKQYNDAPMPYAIFFDEGKAIHGFAGNVGGPASHGCVRLSTGNAKTLFRLVEQQRGLTGLKYDTTIVVR